MSDTNYSVGVTETLERVALNIPPDPVLTPDGVTLLLSPAQARRLAMLLNEAAGLCETLTDPEAPNGH